MSNNEAADVILEIGVKAVREFKRIFHKRTVGIGLDQKSLNLLWFSTIHFLLIDVFANMDDANPDEPADRMKLFEDMVRITREDLKKTLDSRIH